MVVRTIGARRDRKTGDIAVTFTVCPKTWASMTREAKDGGFFGTDDFVAGVLNFHLMEHEPVKASREPPTPSDMDDGIPF